MSKLLIFNWKMNPATLKEASVLAQASDHENVVVAPPFPFMESVADTLIKAKLGAQDLFWEPSGAFTGEVSAQELKNIGVSHVIIGHSERRHKLGETDEVIAKKMKAALSAGLVPVLCVGETKSEKDSGQREAVIERQLKSALSDFQLLTPDLGLIVAYEPVWAIGTGDPETPEHAAETIAFIKSVVSGPDQIRGADKGRLQFPDVRVLYGGSVDSKNLGDFLKKEEIDGALVGGASLKTEEIGNMTEMV